VENISIENAQICVGFNFENVVNPNPLQGNNIAFLLTNGYTALAININMLGKSSITTEEILADIEDAYNNSEDPLTFDLIINENGFCIVNQEPFSETGLNLSIQLNISSVLLIANTCDSFSFTSNNYFVTENCSLSNGQANYSVDDANAPIFQVNIDGEWITQEVTDGTWTSLNDCRIITDWRIIDAENNVITDGIVTKTNCTPNEETKTVCEWLQLHQTAIEELQNQPATGLTCETLGDCPTFQEVQTLASTAVQPESLAGYATESWVALQGYITNVITALGFTPENVANKSTNVNTDQASDTKYPSVKAVYDWATGLFQTAAQVTSAIAAAKPVICIGVDSAATALTGSATNGLLGSILIPANSLSVNDIIEIEAFLKRASPSASPSHRLYINTSASTSGATALALSTGSSASSVSKMERSFIVTNTGLTIFPAGANSAIDDAASNTAQSDISVNWTVNQYLIHSANNAVGETTTNIFLFAKRSRP
jgi:hypothetical protein